MDLLLCLFSLAKYCIIGYFHFFLFVSDTAKLIRPPCGNYTLQDTDAM